MTRAPAADKRGDSPLWGRQVVVTQAQRQAPELGALLALAGATPLYYPCIAIEPPADPAALDAALARAAAGQYEWLIVTSANTVLALADRLKQMGLAPAALAGVKLAAIGAATDEVVAQELGRKADLVPADSKAEGLARALQEVTRRGERMLVPQADIARPVLVQALAGAGLHVTPIVAYRTTAGSGGIDLPAWLRTAAAGRDEARAHAVTFTSPSTVHNLIGRLALEGGNPCDLLGVVRACIGPVTAEALTTAGLAPHVVAGQQSLEGLVEALCEYDWNRQ